MAIVPVTVFVCLVTVSDSLTLQNGYTTSKSVVGAGKQIGNLIKENALDRKKKDLPFIGGFVRLTFHDCVGDGGCDGCINHTLPDNAGLKDYTDKLDLLYDSSYNTKMSRADFYMLSSIVALDMASVDSAVKFPRRINFTLGRVDCSTTPTENKLNTLPDALHGTTMTLEFFETHFGFSHDETVALLGAHTLGRAKIGNLGFEGRWVRRPNKRKTLRPASRFDNEYYKAIFDRPLWFQKKVNASGKIQWQGKLKNNLTLTFLLLVKVCISNAIYFVMCHWNSHIPIFS